MQKVSPLMALVVWPQICRRDSSFMENTKAVTGQIKGQAQKRDMIDTIYTVVYSILHKNNSYLHKIQGETTFFSFILKWL